MEYFSSRDTLNSLFDQNRKKFFEKVENCIKEGNWNLLNNAADFIIGKLVSQLELQSKSDIEEIIPMLKQVMKTLLFKTEKSNQAFVIIGKIDVAIRVFCYLDEITPDVIDFASLSDEECKILSYLSNSNYLSDERLINSLGISRQSLESLISKGFIDLHGNITRLSTRGIVFAKSLSKTKSIQPIVSLISQVAKCFDSEDEYREIQFSELITDFDMNYPNLIGVSSALLELCEGKAFSYYYPNRFGLKRSDINVITLQVGDEFRKSNITTKKIHKKYDWSEYSEYSVPAE
ncbi:MAG TPA: hypothetical protein VFV52_01845 [Bacilli bacterium]|nr:hypothetical protein [Bacilli bacterium]